MRWGDGESLYSQNIQLSVGHKAGTESNKRWGQGWELFPKAGEGVGQLLQVSRYPKGYKGKWSRQVLPHPRGPHGGPGHQPPPGPLAPSPAWPAPAPPFGLTWDQQFSRHGDLFKVLTARNPFPQVAPDSSPYPQ